MSGPLLPPPSTPAPQLARRGLWAIFGATFFELVGYFMLMPCCCCGSRTAASLDLAGRAVRGQRLGRRVLHHTLRLGHHAAAGPRPTLWLSAAVPVVSTTGFLLTDALPVWFACEFIAGAASGLRWVLAEAVVAEFAPPHQRGRMVGLFETMVGTTFVIGPALLALVGPTSPVALWLVLGFLVLGLLGSLWIPRLPAAADAHEARVGLHGVWHALRAHPLIMTVGFVGGFFESGLTSILPLYGLALGMGATAAALLVSASGLGSALMMLPAGMAADRLAAAAPGGAVLTARGC